MIEVEKVILAETEASEVRQSFLVQELWSGYGELKRYLLEGGSYPSVIVKHIQLSDLNTHPRGWNTSASHLRKLHSYKVEKNWYEKYAAKVNKDSRIPSPIFSITSDNEILLILEDLDTSGFSIRYQPFEVSLSAAKFCLSWLASFHAQFIQHDAQGLWSVGTYWHLETRTEELNKMNNHSLKNAAKALNEKLINAKYQTIVHGDAKLANFCFSKDGVAAVDFQYVGKGCGIKDVVYFLSSCFDSHQCELHAEELLDYYFTILKSKLSGFPDFHQLKEEWLELYPIAWADFYRFLDGWNPGHWKMHNYSETQTKKALALIK